MTLCVEDSCSMRNRLQNQCLINGRLQPTGNAAALKLMDIGTDPDRFTCLGPQQTVASTPIIPSPLAEMRRQRVSTFHVAQRHHGSRQLHHLSSLILGQLRHHHDGDVSRLLDVRPNFGSSFLQVTHTRLRQRSVTRDHLPGPFGRRLPGKKIS